MTKEKDSDQQMVNEHIKPIVVEHIKIIEIDEDGNEIIVINQRG